MTRSPDAFGLVARTAERARIDGFVEAIRGGANALLIHGQPGIGKSALWRHAIDRGRAAGYRVLIARPAAEDLRLTLGTLTELFEDTGLLVDGLADLDALARGRRVLAAIRELTSEGPLLLAIDDLPWVDTESSRALRHAIRRLDAEPIGVVATMRDGPVGDPLETLQGLPPGRATAIAVGPLDLEDTRSLLRPFVTGISRPALARIHGISGGNPLYSLELARSLPHDRTPDVADIRPPVSVQAAIARRIDGLPPGQRHAVGVAAVVGPVTLPELREALGEADLVALHALPREADLLTLDDERVRFAHPLIASVAGELIDPLERRSLHARMAAVARDPDTRARHLAYSADEPDAGMAAELEAASERASMRFDFQLEAEFASHAARVTPADDPEARLRRQLAEIEARIGAGETARALALADALAAALPRGPARARALVSRSYAEDEDRDTAEGWLLEALEDSADDEALRGAVLVRLVHTAVRATPEAIDRLQEALAIARRRGDRVLEIRAMAMLGRTYAMSGAPRPEISAEAVRLYDEGGLDALATDPRDYYAKELMWAGELTAARMLLDTVWAELGAVGSELQRMQALYDRSLLESTCGAFDEARRLAERGRELAVDAEETDGIAKFDGVLAWIAVWRGEGAQAVPVIERLLRERGRKSRDTPIRMYWHRGFLALSRGEARSALVEFEAALDLLEVAGLRHPGFVPVLPDAVEAAAAAGMGDRARELLGLLQERLARIDTVWAHATAAWSRGVVLLAEGVPADAVEPLREAVGGFDETGHLPEAARAGLLLGRSLLRSGHRSTAAAALDDARGRFERLGAASWMALCRRELERVAPGRAERSLTPTERRIAELVVEGARNKEIASSLFVSTANVEAHLTRIFRKLDLRSRADLVRWMAAGRTGGAAPDTPDEEGL